MENIRRNIAQYGKSYDEFQDFVEKHGRWRFFSYFFDTYEKKTKLNLVIVTKTDLVCNLSVYTELNFLLKSNLLRNFQGIFFQIKT